MKTLHFVLIAKSLTGDSEVRFFNNRLKAEHFFNTNTQPLLEICERNELEEDEVFNFGADKHIVRFNSGYHSELDTNLGHCHHYYYLAEIEVDDDVTHYFVEFSELVDESTIQFFNEQQAKEIWNQRIDEDIVIADGHYGYIIDRNDETTWEDEDGMTLYQETHYSDIYSDAYFGTSPDITWTFRVSHIIFED